MGKTRLHPTAFISRLKSGARALADPDCSASPIAQLGPKANQSHLQLMKIQYQIILATLQRVMPRKRGQQQSLRLKQKMQEWMQTVSNHQSQPTRYHVW